MKDKEEFDALRDRKINAMLSYLEKFLTMPYVLGGNYPTDKGVDCSGLILEGLRSIGLWGAQDATSQQIFTFYCQNCKMPENPQAGDLIFYGNSRSEITHVAICFNSFQVLEAGGTDKAGGVRLRPLTWRKDQVAILRLNP